MEKDKRISYRAPLSRWKALTDLATERESSIQQLIDEALDASYFTKGHQKGEHAGPQPAAALHPVYPKNTRWHLALDAILDSRVEGYIRAIIDNLDGWSAAARANPQARSVTTTAEIIAEVERLTSHRKGKK